MKIWFHPYQLTPKANLNSKTGAAPREGALVRFFFPEYEAYGHADCHPWVEFGQFPLKEQLKRLAKGQFTAVTERTRLYAEVDAKARSQKRSAFHDLTIPSSHLLVTDPDTFGPPQAEAAMNLGFSRFKIKVGRNPKVEAARLIRIAPVLGKIGKFRLDFNGVMNEQSLREFAKIVEKIWTTIDFFEDPLPFGSPEWEKIKGYCLCNIAVDYRSDDVLDFPWIPEVLIIKPSMQEPTHVMEVARKKAKKVVITTAMDHPLGQLGAAYTAARLKGEGRSLIEHCGLLSHSAYEPNAFSEALTTQGPRLMPPPGTGFGFDELLQKLAWQELA